MAPPTLNLVAEPAKRQNVVLAIVLVVMIVFAGRLVYIQGIAGPALAQAGQDLRTNRPDDLYAPRGTIVDASGTVLAGSVETYDVRVNLTQIPDYRLRDQDREVIGYGALAAAGVLAPILGVPEETDSATYVAELAGSLVGTNGYYLLAAGLTPAAWEQIAALRIDGIYAEHTYRRDYPVGTVAGSILGFVNAEGAGSAGLEYLYDDQLTGVNGKRSAEKGAGGQTIPTGTQDLTPAVPGCDIHLTIDADLQWHSQQVIDAAVQTYDAEWGAAVVIDNATGKILSLADSGSGDPNRSRTEPANAWRLNSLQAVYDPGSTGKVLTVLSALEEGVVTPTSAIEDPMTLTTSNGQTFTDHSPHPDQVLTVAGVLARSANTGTINIGRLMTDEVRYEYMRKLGWGEKTGVELPQESAGLLRSPDKWDGRTKYATMFGQGLSVNLLQNTSVFAAIGNEGIYSPPRIIDRLECDGDAIPTQAPDPVQVVSKKSTQEMIRMLESVVTGDLGTGHRAAVENYRVAGKTGTAQIPDRAGGLTDTAASFVGVVPADNPVISIGVVIYRPTSGFFGGTIAAPVFSEIAEFALPKLAIPPSTAKAKPYPLTVD